MNVNVHMISIDTVKFRIAKNILHEWKSRSHRCKSALTILDGVCCGLSGGEEGEDGGGDGGGGEGGGGSGGGGIGGGGEGGRWGW